MERRNRSRIMMPGVILILIGLWLLLRELGVCVVAVDQAWPAILVLIGVLCLADFALTRGRNKGNIFMGVMLLLVGLVFSNITWGSWEWADMKWLWPVFPAIGGLAFLALFLAQPRDWGVLVPAVMALAVGVIGYLYTTEQISAETARDLAQWWPVLIILVGLGLVSQYLVRMVRK